MCRSTGFTHHGSAKHDGRRGKRFPVPVAAFPCRRRARPGRHAGRHRRRQHHHRRPERRPMGLSPAGAAVPAGADPLYRPGAHGQARRGDRQGPRPADPRALRSLLGLVFDRNADRLVYRRAAQRVLRHRRRRRADGSSRASEPHPGRLGAAGHRLHPQLPVGRAHRAVCRRFRAGVPAGRLARPPEPQRNRRRVRLGSARRSAIPLSRLGQYRRGDHAVDGVLPAVVDRREEAEGDAISPRSGSTRRSARSSPRSSWPRC